MPVERRAVIALAGAETAGPMIVELAREVGHAVTHRGCHLLCSGTGGLVHAACEGAQEEKNNLKRRAKYVGDSPMVMGLLAGTDARGANTELDIALPTGLGTAIHTVVCASCDGLIAIEGGVGTLSYVALAWQLGKPIVLMAPTGSVLEHLVGERLDRERSDMIMTAETAERAVEMLIERIQAQPTWPQPD
jgi:uncharacterized protein (TIGR00725 family)